MLKIKKYLQFQLYFAQFWTKSYYIQMIESPRSKLKVYSIQVSNISCINCANTIKSALSQKLEDPLSKVVVNIMSEKITLTVSRDQTVDKAIEILKTTKFQPLGSPVLLSGNVTNQRTISFLVHKNPDTENIESLCKGIVGVVRQNVTEQKQHYLINYTYNCEIVKGRDLADIIQKLDSKYEVINERISSLASKKKQVVEKTGIKKTVALVFYFLFVNMVIPVLPGVSEIYKSCVTFPSQLGIYSFSVILNIFLTGYVMKYYAKGFIIRAYNNYNLYKTTNMETLIALGSLSACFLFLFFMIRYSIENYNSKLHGIHMAIMDINDALTSASIIVLVVTIGKNIEKRVKAKIQKITDEIFPQSVLFQNMNVHYVQMRNRQLKILNEKDYNVSLIEKNDVIKVKSGRLLLDVCIISGSVKATQSAITGSEQIVVLQKGDRIESGSHIHDAFDCYAVVEKTIEDSLLIEIATHVKFAQNEEESSASGIQTLCNKITSVFVKAVIFLSVTTMAVWTFILYFQLTEVPICNACWVIQRGIGVLVASCPCALGLAVPSVIAIVLKLATKSGILIKKTKVFQKIKTTKIVAFDKTGTLFTKINHIESFKLLNKDFSQQRLWEILALLERDFRHPLAQIIYKQAINRSKMNGPNFSFILLDKSFIASQGITAKILDKLQKTELSIVVGNKQLLKQQKVMQEALQNGTQSCTQIYLSINGKVSMVMSINTHSNLRPQTLEVIQKLQQQKLKVHILSGDSSKSVAKLGENLKLESQSLHAEFTAIDKRQWVKNQQNTQKNNVIMVGDGLNDIPCLQEASIGISINAKSQLNINAADVVILSENIYKILALVRFLRMGNLFIKINLFWAFSYNIVIMPIVAGVFYKYDIFVSPVGSCIAMSVSSLLVVGFSHLLSLFKYDQSLTPKVIQGLPVESVDNSASTREVLTLNQSFS